MENESEMKNDRELRRRHRRAGRFKPLKQLFTRDIKLQLKAWLVRRRHDPYPNRREKCQLAQDLGLTYVQISNWFANWRRKLKNRKSWTRLLKCEEGHPDNNAEFLSISSDDSIWDQDFSLKNVSKNHNLSAGSETIYDLKSQDFHWIPNPQTPKIETKYSKFEQNEESQCFQISSSTDNRQAQNFRNTGHGEASDSLNKWLQSAAKFKPTKLTYNRDYEKSTFKCYCCISDDKTEKLSHDGSEKSASELNPSKQNGVNHTYVKENNKYFEGFWMNEKPQQLNNFMADTPSKWSADRNQTSLNAAPSQYGENGKNKKNNTRLDGIWTDEKPQELNHLIHAKILDTTEAADKTKKKVSQETTQCKQNDTHLTYLKQPNTIGFWKDENPRQSHFLFDDKFTSKITSESMKIKIPQETTLSGDIMDDEQSLYEAEMEAAEALTWLSASKARLFY